MPPPGQGVDSPSTVCTFLFTDIEQSSRLWEQSPDEMAPALARHDAIARAVVPKHSGLLVKMTGDGIHAVFDDPRDAMCACIELQQGLDAENARGGLELRVRCGLHAGVVEHRDNDFFGSAVNRAARIMSAAHGGQVLVSQSVADLLRNRLPPDAQLRDLGSVRLRDLAGAERLYQLLHPALRETFPPLRSLESLPNNLPQQSTSFIGRERELAEASGLLARGRLLTLHGSGGIGKTRLSLQIAAAMLPDFVDGVWVVELASLSDAERMPQAVATVLGIKEDAGRPVIEALLRTLRERSVLIVLDNCEHLIAGCARLARDLLACGPHVKILATSREPLSITGETTYPVPALTLPRADESSAVETVTRFEGVRLFVDRASAASAAFTLTPQNVAAVAEVCRRLDGIPLALELAAARVRSLPIESIARRLDDRFRLLVRGDRAALPRQQTLRALIDWSHDLLPAPERALFRRLAVFAGGYTLMAAEAVTADVSLPETDVLDLHSQLVDKSLVNMDAAGGRYRLLETVREYARERLDASTDGVAVRARHLEYFVAFAEEARSHLFGPGEADWLSRYDVERENLLSAHAACDGAGQSAAQRGLRLVSALKWYLFNRGQLGLAYRITAAALMRPGAEQRDRVRCLALFDAGQICYFMGHYDEAVRLLEESLAVARELDDTDRIARALQPLGLACMGRGDLAAARRHLEEAYARARAQGDKRQVAAAQNQLGQLKRVEGALDDAQGLYDQVLALATELGDRESVAVGLLNLAMVDVARGAPSTARRRLIDVLAIAVEIGSKPAGQSVIEVCAGLASLSGEWSRAALFFGAAEAQASYTGIRRDPADEAFLIPLVHKAREALDADAFARAETAGRALSYAAAIDAARGWLQATG